MSEPATPTRPRRRWFRFSLRSLLVFTVLVGLLMGWIAKERRQSQREQEIARQISKFDYGYFVGPFDLPGLAAEEQSWWRRFARQILGPTMVGINLRRSGIRDISPLAELTRLRFVGLGETGVRDLSPLAGLRRLEIIQADSYGITDLTPLAGITSLKEITFLGPRVNDVTPLAGLVNLIELNLGSTQVSDLRPLSHLTKLKSLSIGSRVSDLSPLMTLTNLELLWIGSARVTQEQVDALKKALPNCTIEY